MLEYKVIQYIKMVFLFFIFIPLIKTDIERKIIPNIYPFSIAVIGFLLLVLTEEKKFFKSLFSSITALLLTAVLVTVIRYFMKKGFGMGDVKLLLSLSWIQGIEIFLKTMEITVLLSFVFIIIMLSIKKIEREDSIPFAPFVAIGTVMAQFIDCI